MKYVVRTYRAEAIDYEVEAASPEDAESRYLTDGEEVRSDLLDSGVEEVMAAEDYYRQEET